MAKSNAPIQPPRYWKCYALLDAEGELYRVLRETDDMNTPAILGLQKLGWSIIPVWLKEEI